VDALTEIWFGAYRVGPRCFIRARLRRQRSAMISATPEFPNLGDAAEIHRPAAAGSSEPRPRTPTIKLASPARHAEHPVQQEGGETPLTQWWLCNNTKEWR
jgi:hypothetical protein